MDTEARGAVVLGPPAEDRPGEPDAAALEYAANARFRALFEQSPISTIIYGADGRPLQVNAAFTRLWGLTIADIPPDYCILTDPQLHVQGVMPLVERAFAGESMWLPPFHYNALPVAPAGRARWTEAFLYPTVDRHGKLSEVVLTQYDVTERVEAAHALQASEARYRSLMTLATEGIWRTTIDTPVPCDLPIDEQIVRFVRDAYIAECNESMAHIQGYPNADAMRGTPLDQVLVRAAGGQEGLRAFIRLRRWHARRGGQAGVGAKHCLGACNPPARIGKASPSGGGTRGAAARQV